MARPFPSAPRPGRHLQSVICDAPEVSTMSLARAGIRGASRLLQASASCRSSTAASASPRCSNTSPRSILRQMEQPSATSQSSRSFCSRRRCFHLLWGCCLTLLRRSHRARSLHLVCSYRKADVLCCSQDLMLRRRGLMTQLPQAIARALARQTSLILLDWQGEIVPYLHDMH